MAPNANSTDHRGASASSAPQPLRRPSVLTGSGIFNTPAAQPQAQKAAAEAQPSTSASTSNPSTQPAAGPSSSSSSASTPSLVRTKSRRFSILIDVLPVPPIISSAAFTPTASALTAPTLTLPTENAPTPTSSTSTPATPTTAEFEQTLPYYHKVDITLLVDLDHFDSWVAPSSLSAPFAQPNLTYAYGHKAYGHASQNQNQNPIAGCAPYNFKGKTPAVLSEMQCQDYFDFGAYYAGEMDEDEDEDEGEDGEDMYMQVD